MSSTVDLSSSIMGCHVGATSAESPLSCIGENPREGGDNEAEAEVVEYGRVATLRKRFGFIRCCRWVLVEGMTGGRLHERLHDA